jgi:beta-glucosidase
MAATFSPELAGEWGVAMGEEFWNKGTNIYEGPGVCIARIEKNGRTFEYLSGEDPVLGGNLASPLVDGIQQNVMAITKHFMCAVAPCALAFSTCHLLMTRVPSENHECLKRLP